MLTRQSASKSRVDESSRHQPKNFGQLVATGFRNAAPSEISFLFDQAGDNGDDVRALKCDCP